MNTVVNTGFNYGIRVYCENHFSMGRRKIEDNNIRSLTKISKGESYAVTLPIEIIRAWGWKERQKLQLIVDHKQQRIIVEDWKK